MGLMPMQRLDNSPFQPQINFGMPPLPGPVPQLLPNLPNLMMRQPELEEVKKAENENAANNSFQSQSEHSKEEPDDYEDADDMDEGDIMQSVGTAKIKSFKPGREAERDFPTFEFSEK